MAPLVEEMTRQQPGDRPTIEQVMQRFQEIQGSLPEKKLRSRYVYRDESLLARPFRAVRHVYRTARWDVTERPAIPADVLG